MKENIGLRGRFRTAAAPAPIPKPATPRSAPGPDHSLLGSKPKQETTSDAEIVRAGGSMAVATLVSRITGFLRNVLIVTALGPAISSAFNTANTLPNLITEIVLGAVLTSLVVPVLVRAEKEDPDHGERFIRQLFTVAGALLGVITIASVATAPWLMQMMLSSEGKVNLDQSSAFAYLLLPQILFYGMFALLMAVLNTKGVFKPGAWAPVANNVIVIFVMLAYTFVPGSLDPEAPVNITNPHILLLGLGTTLGVVVQALIMIPPIRKLGISLKPLWGVDDRLKQFAGMGLAIVVYVAISQLGYVITTRIASGADASAPNIYQQSWLLLQVPYGIIGVTLLTAIMPRLSRNAADGDHRAVVADLELGSKLTFLALVPIVVFFTAFGTQIATGLFAYAEFDVNSATILGLTLSFSAFTLLPYALVLLHLRVFYAREEAWTPTFIIAGITLTKVLLSMLAPLVASSPERVVVLLGAANGFGFVTGAIIGAVLLRRKLGNLGMTAVARTCWWAFLAAAVGVAVAWGIGMLIDATLADTLAGLGSAYFLIKLAVEGTIFLVVTGVVLSKTKLEEVRTVGRALARIPGLGRFLKVDPAEPEATELLREQGPFDATFNATPIPPPMSAGIVRGPRLVPGAEVSDGRFRLLADHGAVPGARFWHAREKHTGREVALVFVDTSGQSPAAPATPAEAAGKAASVATRTRKLARLGSTAIPERIQVVRYRNGCLVIADWTPGRPLAEVADRAADPYAVVAAFQPLARTVAETEEPLGLDNRARLRVSTEGTVTLAFPAVLPASTSDSDDRAIRAAFTQLLRGNDTLPKDVTELLAKEPHELPAAIAAMGDESNPLEVPDEDTPRPEAAPGFGRKGYSRAGLGLVGLATITLVTVIALVVAYLTSVLGNDDAPITTESISTPSSTSVPTPPLVRPLAGASEWPGEAPLPELVDADPNTGFSATTTTVLLTLATPSSVSDLSVTSITGGPANLKVYAVKKLPVTGTEGLTLLANTPVTQPHTLIEVEAREVTALLVEITSDEGRTFGEFTVLGH